MIIDLKLKLSGQLPINRYELMEIVSSWGRNLNCHLYNQQDIQICEPNECYDLSNLDVSQITDFSFIFYSSPYNGDLSKWNISNAQDFESMFNYSKFNNNSISNWNTSNVVDMSMMFFNANFNKDISKWNFNSNIECNYMFVGNKNFLEKYNNSENIYTHTLDCLKWFEENREKMKELNQGTKEDVLDFFSFDDKKEIGL